jgi:small subunit ribosomal protein S7
MKEGKKSTAEKIVYDVLGKLQDKVVGGDPLAMFKKAIANVRPALEVRSRRIGGANYQIPMEVPPDRKTTLALRWILEAARSRKGHSMVDRLMQELTEAANNEGVAVKKKEETHRMAEANRAFAHFKVR